MTTSLPATAIPSSALPTTMAYETMTSFDGRMLAYRWYDPPLPPRTTTRPRAVMIVIHGFGERAMYYDDYCQYMSRTMHMPVVAYDQRGFGASHDYNTPVMAATADTTAGVSSDTARTTAQNNNHARQVPSKRGMVNPDDPDEICKDLVAILQMTHAKLLRTAGATTTDHDPPLPTLLFGHSLGAHVVRRTTVLYPQVVTQYKITGLIMTGSMVGRIFPLNYTIVQWMIRAGLAMLGPDVVVKTMNVTQMTRSTAVQDMMRADPVRTGTDAFTLGYVYSLGIAMDTGADVLVSPSHVLFVQGRHDVYCPVHAFEAAVKACTVPHKQVVWLDNHYHNIVHEPDTPAWDIMVDFCNKCLADESPQPPEQPASPLSSGEAEGTVTTK